MARIRSIHPGLWSDGTYASLSEATLLLAIGLWNEADDNGIFTWKPLDLKMRLCPGRAYSIPDMEMMLASLEERGLVCSFEIDGKTYGAIKNFARWQRPKKPKSVHPWPQQLWAYLGFNADGSRPRYGSEKDDEDEALKQAQHAKKKQKQSAIGSEPVGNWGEPVPNSTVIHLPDVGGVLSEGGLDTSQRRAEGLRVSSTREGPAKLQAWEMRAPFKGAA